LYTDSIVISCAMTNITIVCPSTRSFPVSNMPSWRIIWDYLDNFIRVNEIMCGRSSIRAVKVICVVLCLPRSSHKVEDNPFGSICSSNTFIDFGNLFFDSITHYLSTPLFVYIIGQQIRLRQLPIPLVQCYLV